MKKVWAVFGGCVMDEHPSSVRALMHMLKSGPSKAECEKRSHAQFGHGGLILAASLGILAREW